MNSYRQQVVNFLREAQRRANCETPTALARKAGVSPSTINRFLKRPLDASVPRTDTLFKIAEVAGMTAPSFDEARSRFTNVNGLETIPVIGEVRAGFWQEVFERPKDEWEYITLPFPKNPYMPQRFGLKVEGDSMNIEFPSGTVVICTRVEDLQEPIQSGEFVVCLRKRGDLIEATLKEYVVDDDGQVWLWPRSDNPAYTMPWKLPIGVDEINQDDGLHIFAVVDAEYRPRRKRR